MRFKVASESMSVRWDSKLRVNRLRVNQLRVNRWDSKLRVNRWVWDEIWERKSDCYWDCVRWESAENMRFGRENEINIDWDWDEKCRENEIWERKEWENASEKVVSEKMRVTFLVLTRGRELFQANPATLFRIGQCGM
jgi:hypothetical protein